MNQTAEQALTTIRDAKPDAKVRIMRRLEVGQAIQQGDVYLIRVDDAHPRGKLRGSRQVAVGDTIGSRHVVQGDVEVFEGAALPPCMRHVPRGEVAARLGPVVVAPQGVTLTHPEHAHHRLPAGTYQVLYQFDFATRARVAD